MPPRTVRLLCTDVNRICDVIHSKTSSPNTDFNIKQVSIFGFIPHYILINKIICGCLSFQATERFIKDSPHTAHLRARPVGPTQEPAAGMQLSPCRTPPCVLLCKQDCSVLVSCALPTKYSPPFRSHSHLLLFYTSYSDSNILLEVSRLLAVSSHGTHGCLSRDNFPPTALASSATNASLRMPTFGVRLTGLCPDSQWTARACLNKASLCRHLHRRRSSAQAA